jgi:hypothetical protein
MGIVHKFRDAWINFVTPNKGKRKVHVKRCELFTLNVPAVAVSEDEKYDFIVEAAKILEKEIKVSKPKSKSKNKSK